MPRASADYCDAVLSGEIVTSAACGHSSRWRRSQNAGWLRV